ncbi:MAG: hypothetical protein EON95_16570 [Caulobacteraceae bacterium]|nr:MAG: hypothetical protein EON95_16570 [Caulobacteraceae bacterium]
MSRKDRQIATIERRWKARFGEPPSLRTDPELMLQILEADILSGSRTSETAPPEQEEGARRLAAGG